MFNPSIEKERLDTLKKTIWPRELKVATKKENEKKIPREARNCRKLIRQMIKCDKGSKKAQKQ